MSKIQTSSSACNLRMREYIEDYEYFKDGTFIIGGVLSVNHGVNEYVAEYGIKLLMMCVRPQTHYYKNLLSFLFTISNVNKEMGGPHNISVGYHIFDSCSDERKAVKSVLQILSGPGETIPNYSCTEQGKVAGFIGEHHSSRTVAIAQILKVYGYAQISYGATHTIINDRRLYPNVFRTVRNDHVNYSVISKLLKYFGWNWVGILSSDDDNGEKETQVFTEYLKDDGICVAFVLKISKSFDYMVENSKKMIHVLKQTEARVIIFCGEYSLLVSFAINIIQEGLIDKTIILGPNWALKLFLLNEMPHIFNGSLTVQPFAENNPDLQKFINGFHPLSHPEDKLLENIWLFHFKCLPGNSEKKKYYESAMGISLQSCTWKQHISNIPYIRLVGESNQVAQAVSAMGSAIFLMYKAKLRHFPSDKIHIPHYKHQVPFFLKHIQYQENQRLYNIFNKEGEMNVRYMTQNWLAWLENRILDSRMIVVFDPQTVIFEKTDFDMRTIIWKYHPKHPKSQCSENCRPGYRKVMRSGIHSCCYECARCSEGEISNVTDSENCIQCSKNEWPNRDQDHCIPKQYEFLSYTEDAIGVVLTSLSALFTLVTALILGIFIYYCRTPIVKANNRSLSFVLLVSIMLSFPCVFLFLGRPEAITCMLRQTAFGVIFSVAMSTVLAKTIMVCIAFRATKPGSKWKKWLNVKLSNSIVVLCSSVQVIITISWLVISPPFEELNTYSYHSKIVVQCNEGLDIAFYCVLGYMGLLATVSFIIAFLARTLPDSFNEAKYITFSMLVFCSVWIAMIPAYLSTKGKYMVAVEIFAILASSAGLLGCIFFPKCYIILFRPEINTKTYLLGNR